MRHLIAYIFWTAGDRSISLIFNPLLQTPTALKDDQLIDVFINIIAPIRCLLICERQSQISKGK